MTRHPLYRKGTIALCLLALLALMLVASGCTQPAPQQQTAPAPVTATQTDSNRILISYPGSTDTTDLIELEITITDSAGKSQTKSIGSRLATMPIRFGTTETLAGTFDGNDHVMVTGYFLDGSQRHVLDTTL